MHRSERLPSSSPFPAFFPPRSTPSPFPQRKGGFWSTDLALVHIHLQEHGLGVFVTQGIEGWRDSQARATPVGKVTLPLNSTFILPLLYFFYHYSMLPPRKNCFFTRNLNI